MRKVRKNGLWAGVLASFMVLTGMAAPAAAASSAPAPVTVQAAASTNRLVVKQNEAGAVTIEEGSVLRAGQVIKAEFNTLFPAGDLEILQLHHGATLEQVDVKIAEAGQGGAVAEAAMRWFTGTWDVKPNIPAKTTFYGGRPFFGSNKFDLVLAPGTYIVTQLRLSGNVKPSTVEKMFTVVGPAGAQLPVVDGNISVGNADGTTRFSVNSITKGADKLKNGPVRLINRTGSITNRIRELVLFDFTRVPQGTTPAQACALVTAQGPGNAASFGTMSTQRLVNGHLNVPLGSYWLTSWVPKAANGTPPALDCEGTLIEVVA